MRTTLLAALILALAAAPASAATLKLKDGSTVTGKATRYDSPSKTLYFHTDAGQDVQYTLDQLDARTVYMVNSSLVPKDDAQKMLAVANFARDAGLYAHAARRYGEVLKLAPELKETVDQEMTQLRRLAAENCMKQARAAITKGDSSEAEKWLTVLVEKLPGEPEATEAKAIIDQHYAKNRAAKEAKVEAQTSAAFQKEFEKGREHYKAMVDKCQRGLQASGSSQAEALFRGSIADGKSLMAEIDRLAKRHDVPQMRENADKYRGIVTDQMVEAHLHIANAQSVQSDYKGAMREVNAALALDPKNEAALSARARIEENSSRGLEWGRRL